MFVPPVVLFVAVNVLVAPLKFSLRTVIAPEGEFEVAEEVRFMEVPAQTVVALAFAVTDVGAGFIVTVAAFEVTLVHALVATTVYDPESAAVALDFEYVAEVAPEMFTLSFFH